MNGGRYSYDDPPPVGAVVLSPNGREYVVVRIDRFRNCTCRRVGGGTLTVTFQANDLRVTTQQVTPQRG